MVAVSDLLLGLVWPLLKVLALWRISQRAGIHPVLSLLGMLPGLGVCLVIGTLAFSPWTEKSQARGLQ